MCLGCERKRQREKSYRYRDRIKAYTDRYRKTKRGLEVTAKYQARTYAKYQEAGKWKVWAAVKYAISNGRLQRTAACQKCTTEGKVSAHHEDYSKPLDVVWLCRKCHDAKHRLLLAAMREAKSNG
jgi:hypothetical protein